MSIFRAVMSGEIRAAHYEELLWRSVFPDYDERCGSGYGTGIHVNERNASTVSDFFKCAHVLSEDIAKLPKRVMRQVTIAGRETRQPAPTHPLHWLIHAEPNPLMSAFRYFETGIIHLLTWGNWYSYIQRGPKLGRVQALYPLCPHLVRIEPRRTSDPEYVRYWYMVINPETNEEQRFFPDEILHVPFFSYDGICGQSPVRLLMDTFGLAKSQERYGVRFFGNSARLSGLVSPAEGASMTKEQRESLEESLKKYQGVNNAGRLAVIQGAIKWQAITMPNDEAQFLESRKLSQVDIAGIFRVAPHKISNLENAHFTNIEESNIAHGSDTLQPICERIEQEFERALLQEYDKGKVFIDIELNGLMRGNMEARTNYYQARFNMGSIVPNEIRALENEPPLEEDGADEPWMQLNMVPMSMARELLTAKKQQPTQQPRQNPSEADQEEMQNIFMAELQARVNVSYGPLALDAVGRINQRKQGARESYAPLAFRPIFESLAEMLRREKDESFIDDYLTALGKRAAQNGGLDPATELRRMVEALTGVEVITS